MVVIQSKLVQFLSLNVLIIVGCKINVIDVKIFIIVKVVQNLHRGEILEGHYINLPSKKSGCGCGGSIY